MDILKLKGKNCAYPKQITVLVNEELWQPGKLWGILKGNIKDPVIMIYFVLIFGVVGYLFGSEPVTRANLPQLAVNKTSFEVTQPFPVVFDNLMTASKQCYLNQPNEEQITVWGEKNIAKKTANIRIEHVYAMTPHEMYIMVDVKSLGEDKTQVDVYNADDTAKDSLENYKKWSTAKPERC